MRSGLPWHGRITRDRKRHGAYYHTVPSLIIEDTASSLLDSRVGTFQNYFRLSKEEFDFVLARVSPKVTKCDTHLRVSISAEERLIVTLRYLASGMSMTALHYDWCVSVANISAIVVEACDAIYQTLKDEVMTTPSRYHGSLYVFCAGQLSLRSLLSVSHTSMMLEPQPEHQMGVYLIAAHSTKPSTMALSSSPSTTWQPVDGADPLSYTIVGNEAFPLKEYLMRPFPMRCTDTPDDPRTGYKRKVCISLCNIKLWCVSIHCHSWRAVQLLL